MLNTLRKIVQEVNAAKDLKAALTIIVQGACKEAMGSHGLLGLPARSGRATASC